MNVLTFTNLYLFKKFAYFDEKNHTTNYNCTRRWKMYHSYMYSTYKYIELRRFKSKCIVVFLWMTSHLPSVRNLGDFFDRCMQVYKPQVLWPEPDLWSSTLFTVSSSYVYHNAIGQKKLPTIIGHNTWEDRLNLSSTSGQAELVAALFFKNSALRTL